VSNLFIAQDIRPRDLSRRWKDTMERLAAKVVGMYRPGPAWGYWRIEKFDLSRSLFVWLRSGR